MASRAGGLSTLWLAGHMLDRSWGKLHAKLETVTSAGRCATGLGAVVRHPISRVAFRRRSLPQSRAVSIPQPLTFCYSVPNPLVV